MVQLVLIYCLSADSLSCIEKRPMSEMPLTTTECMIEAQPIAAMFLRDHPTYTLNTIRCEIDHPDEKDI